MKPQNLKTQIIYGIISGFIYASFIAIVDYFRDKEFDLKKFIVGLIIFGIAMIIATKIKSKKEN
jgi:phosphate starvation-inducible membrane PsiE